MKVFNLMLALGLVSACASPQKIVNRIDDPLEKRQAKFLQCYTESDSYQRDQAENELRSMTVNFLVMPDGKVKNEKIIKSDFKDPNLHQCVLWLTRETAFAPSNNATAIEVQHPLNFRMGL